MAFGKRGRRRVRDERCRKTMERCFSSLDPLCSSVVHRSTSRTFRRHRPAYLYRPGAAHGREWPLARSELPTLDLSSIPRAPAVWDLALGARHTPARRGRVGAARAGFLPRDPRYHARGRSASLRPFRCCSRGAGAELDGQLLSDRRAGPPRQSAAPSDDGVDTAALGAGQHPHCALGVRGGHDVARRAREGSVRSRTARGYDGRSSAHPAQRAGDSVRWPRGRSCPLAGGDVSRLAKRSVCYCYS